MGEKKVQIIQESLKDIKSVGWLAFRSSSASARDSAEQPGKRNILMAQVGGLLNSGMQKPGNWGNGASVDSDCVLVKMSVKTEKQGCREMLEGLKPEEKNRNHLPPTLLRMINAI